MKVVEMMKLYKKGNKLMERAREIETRLSGFTVRGEWKFIAEQSRESAKVFSALDELACSLNMEQETLACALAGDEDSFIRACIQNENKNNEQEEN